MDHPAQRRWFAVTGAAYLVLWGALAIAPHERGTWALENMPTVVFGIVLFLTRRKLVLSRVSYSLIFVFLTLTAIGAYYTYARVPYPGAPVVPEGTPIGAPTAERNMYDRWIHFAFGLLMAYPNRELVLRIADLRGFWGYLVPVAFIVALSGAFEIVEWCVVLVFGERAGTTYLATQGDPWDAQKDMAVATVGSLLALGAVAVINLRIQRDFAREWADSLRVKRPTPLGEEFAKTGRV